MISRLRDLLSGALGDAGLETASDVWQIAELWTAALGPRIAQRASPLRLVRGELVIAVADAVWRQELAFLGPEIAARLNGALGRDVVQRIRLVGGDAGTTPGAAPRRPRRLLASRSASAGAAPAPRAADASALPADLAAALESLRARRAARLASDSGHVPSARTRRR